MYKNTAFMALSTGARLCSAVILFVILARLLGPNDFGLFMYSFTLASIGTLVVEYGFQNQILREVGKFPASIDVVMAQIFLAKIILTAVLILICTIAAYFWKGDSTEIFIFFLLLFSTVVASFADFLNVAFRTVGKYHEETKVVALGSVVHFLLVLFIAIANLGLVYIAIGFLISRLFYLLITFNAYKRIIGSLKVYSQSFAAIWGKLKQGFPYATDSGFTNLFNQIDTIIVKYALGTAAVGIYQAAIKFLNGAMQFAPVLGNVFVPAIANQEIQSEKFKELTKKLNFQMIGLGVLSWAIFTYGGSYITDFIYGAGYSALNKIWPHIGLLVFARYVAASQGIILTASGSQKVRVLAQIPALLVLVVLSPLLMQEIGISGMIYALIISFVTILILYAGALKFKKISTGFTLLSSGITFFIVLTSFYELME